MVAEPDEAVTWTVTVAAPDRTGLFATIAGVLALHRLSVRSAQVRTEARHGARRLDRGARPRPRARAAEALRNDVARALDGDLDVTQRLAGARRQPPAAGRPARGAARRGRRRRRPTTATVVEVRAGDRPGLLYRLGRALALMGVNIRGARVVTLGAEAVDVFYLQDAAGEPLVGPRGSRGGAAAHGRGGLSTAAGADDAGRTGTGVNVLGSGIRVENEAATRQSPPATNHAGV